ncbi:MAG: auracyanin-A [Herpetosiphonaceae bacterium]|nr:MAG: auracyanin-A [Herpetosiphonaceae bacterium]
MKSYPQQVLVLLIAGALLILAACGAADTPASSTEGSDGAKQTTVEIVATEFSFAPKTIKAKANQPITIVFKNNGNIEHDWSIAAIEAKDIHSSSEAGEDSHSHSSSSPATHVVAMPGKSATLTFTPTKAGEYEFICTIAGHKEAGMSGILQVED